MKDVQITLRNKDQIENKNDRFLKRISLRYWVGWGGGYSGSKKKS
ncbi:MAG: hypothetical protein ABJN95_06935 [Maribacter sp.]